MAKLFLIQARQLTLHQTCLIGEIYPLFCNKNTHLIHTQSDYYIYSLRLQQDPGIRLLMSS